ncbi:MAG: hypothetical protein CO141_03790 [Candidatus Moranbacteria bacterium CG_4_9_14_3_um_filter_42_9]|nr:MAG: hypothetical protein CO141_03790 [Candidatus Moranbacteria bacterium CG_4_9_14_3_um_filter_42_9]
MKIVEKEITIGELEEMSGKMFGNLVKAVVDVEKEIMAIDADLHADEEALLLEKGSEQKNLWGINIYPEMKGPDFVEFDSMINLRPSQNNRSRGVEDVTIQKNILEIVEKLVKKNEQSA